MNGNIDYFQEAVRLQGLAADQYRPPPAERQGQAKTISSMTEAFASHCNDGGQDFLQYLRPWHMVDALETINDAANGGYTNEAALQRIREALGELIAIAVVGHREALEWEGVE